MPTKKKPGKRPVGRPKAVIDPKQVITLAAMNYTDAGIASALCIARSTLQKNFRAELIAGREVLENSINVKQFERAMAGDAAMLKWVGIQRCGQRGQLGLSSPDGGPVEVRKLVSVDL